MMMMMVLISPPLLTTDRAQIIQHDVHLCADVQTTSLTHCTVYLMSTDLILNCEYV